MSLVAYDSSDDSDTEVNTSNNDVINTAVGINKSALVTVINECKNSQERDPCSSDQKGSHGNVDANPGAAVISLLLQKQSELKVTVDDVELNTVADDVSLSFLSLPKPKYHDIQIMNDQKLKIPVIPVANSELSEPTIPKRRKFNGSQNSCGLMSMLPVPKSEASITENFSKSSTEAAVQKHANLGFLPRQVTKNAEVKKSQVVEHPAPIEPNVSKIDERYFKDDEYFEDDEFEVSNDVMLHEDANNSNISVLNRCEETSQIKNDLFPLSANTDFDDSLSGQPFDVLNQVNEMQYSPCDDSVNNIQHLPMGPIFDHYIEPRNSYELENTPEIENKVSLNDEAIAKLCSRRGKGQIIPSDVELIDLNEDAVLSQSKLMLTKQLTEETSTRLSHNKKDGPSSLQKRKHQITYLAHQAKERELELKNQWASNRMTKKQTQAKYGF